ncbi:MAG TPA: glycosyltransferase family 4 protein, partial [Cyclobacteriaceae bacterium]|nr:glycosyltransferase family 4 protein [Cyclobacteriaceae bacterium]
RHIDVMFHPSDLESFGRVFIEAMAAGVPVVGVNQGGALEMVKDGINGYLVPVGNTQEAAERIADLVDSVELRSTFGRRGRELVTQKYSLDLLCEQMISLYREVVIGKLNT